MCSINDVYILFTKNVSEARAQLIKSMDLHDVVVLNGTPYRLEVKTFFKEKTTPSGHFKGFMSGGYLSLVNVEKRPRIGKTILQKIANGEARFMLRKA